jgi:hypothetical protein
MMTALFVTNMFALCAICCTLLTLKQFAVLVEDREVFVSSSRHSDSVSGQYSASTARDGHKHE